MLQQPQRYLPWARGSLCLETNHRPKKQAEEDIRAGIHCTLISNSLWGLRGSAKKLLCRVVCRQQEYWLYTSYKSTKVKRWTQHYDPMFHTIYDIFNSSRVKSQTDNAVPQKNLDWNWGHCKYYLLYASDETLIFCGQHIIVLQVQHCTMLISRREIGFKQTQQF